MQPEKSGRPALPRFNPLPSPKQGEMWTLGCKICSNALFQSAPLAEARGDTPASAKFPGACGFNPLPSPKQGEMVGPIEVTYDPECFNPLPPPKQGEMLSSRAASDRRKSFNPLPPPKQGEITAVLISARSVMEFQSAPPAEARGDPPNHGVLLAPVLVSIRSPRRSKGRSALVHLSLRRPHVSIRSPRRSKGRSAPLSYRSLPRSGFNPLPSPKQGEIWDGLRASLAHDTFQSAPLAEARGDDCKPIRKIAFSRFQSAPLTEARGDRPSFT